MPSATITAVRPVRAVEGGRITIEGRGFPLEASLTASMAGVSARVAFASPRRLVLVVPEEIEGGEVAIRVPGVSGEAAHVAIGAKWATGLHQVDSPVFDAEGNLFVTYSGSRGQEAAVSLFRVTREGTREPFASGIVNATSMAIGPDRRLYVSSRFEGAVYRFDASGTHEQVAADLGAACGLAFDTEGAMYVGDRSGTVFRVQGGRASVFATLPPSVAAFHLAMSPEDELYVTGPTLNPYDHIYRIDRQGRVHTLATSLGRPQGLGFGPDGRLHVVEALAGASGVYRIASPDASPELIVSGSNLVGIAFGPRGEMVVSSNESVYRFS
jgi:DNA-binding beta-propeller fold protein YncE